MNELERQCREAWNSEAKAHKRSHGEYFPPVEIDASGAHPDIVFFQDRATLYTLAVDAESCCVISSNVTAETPDNAIARVMREFYNYRSRQLAHVRRLTSYRKARRENE